MHHIWRELQTIQWTGYNTHEISNLFGGISIIQMDKASYPAQPSKIQWTYLDQSFSMNRYDWLQYYAKDKWKIFTDEGYKSMFQPFEDD